MKRVLFVDDERKALEDLKIMLQVQEFPWEAAYASSGKSALDLMAEKPFDVIISDIRMPEMDGAALLKIVCERFPGAVRIVVCSQEEMNGALRAVPVAHQFLLKPCDPHMLRVAVERATSLSDVLSNKMLASIVGSVKDLPVLPRTFMALREKLADPNASVKEVVKLVEQDISIAAKILQLVNSAFFGLPREISTMNTAVSYLGIDMLQNLVLSAEVFRVFENAAKLPGFSFEELHEHSQLTAKIASHIPVPAAVHSAAVVAGLLHDVGKLVLATRSPKHFARVLEGAAEEAAAVHRGTRLDGRLARGGWRIFAGYLGIAMPGGGSGGAPSPSGAGAARYSGRGGRGARGELPCAQKSYTPSRQRRLECVFEARSGVSRESGAHGSDFCME
jgi:response regulator RpfG family c-di-GMP phosphodiesterase